MNTPHETLSPNHPAVKAAVEDQSFGTLRRLHGTNRNNPQQVLGLMRNILRTAIRNLTADDIRDTDAAEEIRTEGWMQGWAAGRDLDGDEDAIPYLRDTPAGRALMAEALEDEAYVMDVVISNGDAAEVAAPVSGETGRGSAVAARDALYENPAQYLRNRARIYRGGDA